MGIFYRDVQPVTVPADLINESVAEDVPDGASFFGNRAGASAEGARCRISPQTRASPESFPEQDLPSDLMAIAVGGSVRFEGISAAARRPVGSGY